MDQKENDKALFRQSATLISAGFFLIVIGQPTLILIIGIILLFASLFFLIVAILELWKILPKLTQFVRSLGDSLTILFIVISTVGVISKWAEIKEEFVKGIPLAITSDQWLEPIRQFLVTSDFFIYLIFVFWLIFDGALLFIAIKHVINTWRESGRRRTLCLVAAAILFVLGVYGMTIFTTFSSIGDDILFCISLLFTAGSLFYLTKQTTKSRSTYMDQKDKIRESAIAIETSANLIGKLIILDCSPEMLKDILNVPLKHLEDDLHHMRQDVDNLR